MPARPTTRPRMSKLIQIMRTLRTMPPLPEVASRVLEIVRDPEYSIDALVGIVRTDPGLTTRILKLCNSSLFGLNHTVTTVSDAVAYLGTQNLVKLVLVSCTESYFKDLPANPYADSRQLWRQTLACSTACQALAEHCGHGQPATAFTAGILHNVGRIAIVQVAPGETLELCAAELQRPAADPLEVERQIIGLDHAAASGIVAESWGLPSELRRAARNHHNETHIAADDDLTALLHVADAIVTSLGIGGSPPESPSPSPPQPSPAALQKLRLHPRDLEEVGGRLLREMQRIDKLLNPEPQAGR